MTLSNYANNIFAVQEMVNNCAMEILNAHADYEHGRSVRKQAQANNDEYNELVDAYNLLLSKAKRLAQFHREAQNNNASLQEHISTINHQYNELVGDNQNLYNALSQKDDEIQFLKTQLKSIDQELQKSKAEVKNLSETVFTFTLVNTILSTRTTALKNIMDSWEDGKIYQKQSFINALKEAAKKVDFAKNQVPTTTSVEAFAYLEKSNKSLLKKLQNLSI